MHAMLSFIRLACCSNQITPSDRGVTGYSSFFGLKAGSRFPFFGTVPAAQSCCSVEVATLWCLKAGPQLNASFTAVTPAAVTAIAAGAWDISAATTQAGHYRSSTVLGVALGAIRRVLPTVKSLTEARSC